MPRKARIVVPGYPHHVTHRGNRRSDIFLDDDDRRFYLYLLQKYTERYKVDLWSYSLMTNHTHLITLPYSKESLSEAMKRADGRYAMYFNAKYGFVGHLWQGRFFSCALDDPHLRSAVRYVERNPVRAGMVARAEDYPWSSAAANCGVRHDPVLSDGLPLKQIIPDWAKWLEQPTTEEEFERIRRMTRAGRPCGSEQFIEELEKLFGLDLRQKPRGKKKKEFVRTEGV
ncbi:MAG TPA: transposase [Acidobacteriota bacterium]|jgi:putative transposase